MFHTTSERLKMKSYLIIVIFTAFFNIPLVISEFSDTQNASQAKIQKVYGWNTFKFEDLPMDGKLHLRQL